MQMSGGSAALNIHEALREAADPPGCRPRPPGHARRRGVAGVAAGVAGVAGGAAAVPGAAGGAAVPAGAALLPGALRAGPPGAGRHRRLSPGPRHRAGRQAGVLGAGGDGLHGRVHHLQILPARPGRPALAGRRLPALRRALLRVRRLRHVPVPPAACPGEGARPGGHGRCPRRRRRLPAPRAADGAAPRRHGAGLLPRGHPVAPGQRRFLPGLPPDGRAEHALRVPGQGPHPAAAAAHGAAQAERAGAAGDLPGLPRAPLPVPLLGLRAAAGPGAAARPGRAAPGLQRRRRRPGRAPALLVRSHLPRRLAPLPARRQPAAPALRGQPGAPRGGLGGSSGWPWGDPGWPWGGLRGIQGGLWVASGGLRGDLRVALG